MLTKMEGLPPQVAAFNATGEVTKNNYDAVLVPELERVKNAHGHIHFLMVMQTPAKEFSLGAWIQDAWQGLRHFGSWKKVAIVTDETTIEKLSTMFSAVIPGTAKGFPLSQLEAAKTWVAQEG